MAGPYRDTGGHEPAEAPRDAGIVGDVIAQFADSHAYLRELVQNSIDAGSPSVDVEVSYERDDQRLRVAVRDRGEGMSREIIENQLLVLFRSTKEKDRTKIGKFGIGFASVLSPNPEVVTVTTARAGRRLTLHLYRDLSYELFDAGPATQSGTVVELENSMPDREVKAYRAACEEALRRWCRHATVPIQFIDARQGEKHTTRIDRPLELEHALVQVTRTIDDGQLTVVVGVGGDQLELFNHGLMLKQEVSSLVGKGLSCKIQDARLGHTLSRDDVRRDAHFDRAIAFAREVAREALADAISVEMRSLAADGKLAEHARLVQATSASDVRPARWFLPLVEPALGSRVLDTSQASGHLWVATESTAITRALATTGAMIVHVGAEGLRPLLAPITSCAISSVATELTLITPEDPSDHDEAIVACLAEVLDKVHRKPRSILVATLEGVHADALAICARDDGDRVVGDEDARRSPFGVLFRRVLVLSARAPAVRAARTVTDPRVAASHLARAILLQYRLLDVARSQKILDLALDHAGVST